MKIALLQCDVVCGDLDGNRHKIVALAGRAGDVDLCVIPGQALTGPGREAEQLPAFPCRMERALDQLAADMAGGPGLLGHAPEVGHFLARAGYWSKVEHVFEFGNLRLGVDLRPEDASAIDVGIAMTPRNFVPGANDEWELILSGFCRQNCIWGVSVNLCGGYGGEIYAGQSMAMGPNGVLAAKAKAFAEDCLVVDLAAPYGDLRIEPSPSCWEEAVWQALMLGVRDFVAKAGAAQVLLGLSGGMDSALVACIAARALGSRNVTGVLMPSPYTSRESVLSTA